MRNGTSAIALTAVLAALVWGTFGAYGQWWMTDDAFISFRYARNLVEGQGLVYNAGEYVEGFTNPLWTLWVALGLAFGFTAEGWSAFWGLVCYAGAIVLLGVNGRLAAREEESRSWVLPLAAVAAALHADWQVWATGGLETSAFTFLLLAGWTAAVWNRSRPTAAGLSGAVLALAALTRHDGVLVALVVGAWLLLWGRPRAKLAVIYGLSFAAIWTPFTLWRLSYYGSLLPNTFYAKSASVAWYSQGWDYLALYLEKYWIVVLGVPLWLVALGWRRRGDGSGGQPRMTVVRVAVAALAVAGTYILYVVRVGGDFMFARMLIPATPFLLLLFEFGCLRMFRWRPLVGYTVGIIAIAGMVLSPAPIRGISFRHGVANEREHYAGEVVSAERTAATLARYLDGLPVRVAIFGGEARLAYKARFDVAIECGGALTEPEVARRALTARSRPGHEKYPSALYLIEQREAQLSFAKAVEQQLQVSRYIPRVWIKFDDGLFGRVLNWNPGLMEELRRRGAGVPDIERMLDATLERFPGLEQDERSRVYEGLERFYFRHVPDVGREAAFRAGL